MNRGLLIALALLLVVSGSLAAWSGSKLLQMRRAPEVKTQAVKTPPPGSDQDFIKTFELTERSGKPLGNEDLEGQVWIGSFFFAACPGSCRTQNMHLMGLQRKYAERGVKIVSITCDPRVDTPERLREYAESFQAKSNAWYFLTGDLGYIKRIGAEYFRVYVDERGHMDRFIAVDKWGNIRGYYDWHDPKKLEELDTLLETLLAETEPPADLPEDPANAAAAAARKEAVAAAAAEELAELAEEDEAEEAVEDQVEESAATPEAAAAENAGVPAVAAPAGAE